MITPLKDRFGAQIRTHYPLDVDTEAQIALQEARSFDIDDVTVSVPDYMVDIVCELSQLARESPKINQRSGVSVRLTVANLETLAASAIRRGLRAGDTQVSPRISDLDSLAASTAGKVEIESLDEGRDAQILEHLVKAAVLTVFKDTVDPTQLPDVLEAFAGRDLSIDAGQDVPSTDLAALLGEVPALTDPVRSLTNGSESPADIAAAVEFILEGLHLSKRLNKHAVAGRAVYQGRQ